MTRRIPALAVVLAGHPLYRYAGDGAAGDANGQGLSFFGALWYVVSPSGGAITTQTSGGGSAPRGY